MFCAKCGWNWPSGSCKDDENMKILQMDRQTDGRQTKCDQKATQNHPYVSLGTCNLNQPMAKPIWPYATSGINRPGKWHAVKFLNGKNGVIPTKIWNLIYKIRLAQVAFVQ